jgi:RimJ/RimL family protein N-acetyltransferase
MFLETEKIGLRQLELEDLAQARERTREYAPLNMLNQERWLESLLNRQNLMFAIVRKDSPEAFIGVCGLAHIDWQNRNAEFSYYIGDNGARGKGYARHVSYLLFDYGFRELGLHRIWGEIYGLADDILAIDKKLGFHHEATLRETYFCNGQFWDSWIVSMLGREWDEIRENYLRHTKTVQLKNEGQS